MLFSRPTFTKEKNLVKFFMFHSLLINELCRPNSPHVNYPEHKIIICAGSIFGSGILNNLNLKFTYFLNNSGVYNNYGDQKFNWEKHQLKNERVVDY